jgi:hypothetical protein
MIQVNLLVAGHSHYSNRISSTKVALREFYKMKEENASKVKINIYCNHEKMQEWEELLTNLVVGTIDTNLVGMPDDEYIKKVHHISKTDTEYVCKWDDDVFINRHVWDYMIENIDVLNDERHYTLCPIFGNGIPSAELFIEDFLTEEQKQQAHKIFIKDGIDPTVWGCNYIELNNYIKSLTEWNGNEYWKVVENHDQTKDRALPWYFNRAKGIHPARFSGNYNKFLLDYTINNIDRVFEKRDYYLDADYFTPYWCNNLFISKTNFYVDAQNQFFDGWDEGQMNMLAYKLNKVPVYVRNSFGIHMAYGCTTDQKEIESGYCTNVFEKFV